MFTAETDGEERERGRKMNERLNAKCKVAAIYMKEKDKGR